jgi:hypothetical protein
MVTPPDTYPHTAEQQGKGATIAGVAVAAAAAGAAFAVASKVAQKIGEDEKGKK